MNIGKYVDRIDKNITNVLNTQKTYSNLLQNLRKDVEEFTIDYVKYLKEVESEQVKEGDLKEKKDKLHFEELENLEKIMDSDFNIEDFLNPKKGTKRWLEEQPEKLRVLIDEKKFSECVNLVKEICNCELELVDYETKLELDNVYNYLIEKLTVGISRCSSSKDIKYFLEQMKTLGCSSLAIDTFLNWLSKKLKTKVNKISNKEEKDDKSQNINKTTTISGSILNTIQEEDEPYGHVVKNKNLNTNNKMIKSGEPTSTVDTKNPNALEGGAQSSIQANNSRSAGLKIIKIIEEYFKTLEKFIEIMEKYFGINNNIVYSSYIIPWLKQEIQIMTKTMENLFTKIKNINELKSIMRYINHLFNNFDSKGQSAKYIFDLYFINNIKISLEAIINCCMKADKEGNSFDLKEYEIKHHEKIIKIHCVSELGNAVSNVSQIISDFIIEFINNKQKFIGLIFLEEYFFETILAKDFLTYLKSKVQKNKSNNFEVKPFYDGQDLATSNQILINYGISILSIETLFDFFLNEMASNKLICPSSTDSIRNIKLQIAETKYDYFSNLFKVKIELHFFKFYSTNKAILSKDLTEEFKEPDRAFMVFFSL